MTQGDKIRTMTDEELAKFTAAWGTCPDGRYLGDPGCNSCKQCWLDWLKQEVADTPELIGGGGK